MNTRRLLALLSAVLAASACTDAARAFTDTATPVEVRPPVEPPPPPPPPPLTPLLPPARVELVYTEAPPLPLTHALRARLVPTGARTLREVQAVEVEVDVRGGPAGQREVAVQFVSPQGLVWERKALRLDRAQGELGTARFSLPVASTFLEEQALAGAWQVSSFDEGVAQASATFTLEP